MNTIDLPSDYALILQQIDEAEEEDIQALAETLSIERGRLAHAIGSLKNKGLIRLNHTTQSTWISLSTKGKKLVTKLWPPSGSGVLSVP
jgi:DNA-binding MarR family transcriptional regulator